MVLHNVPLIFAWIWAAFIAMAFWESYVEGRNAWDKKKLGWELKIGGFAITAYHFFLFWVMMPLLLSLPLVVYGWDPRLFGILLSAFATGAIIEDFFWYLVNPAVKLKEWRSSFSDYYPWMRIGGKKVIPWGYVLGIAVAIESWYLFWR